MMRTFFESALQLAAQSAGVLVLGSWICSIAGCAAAGIGAAASAAGPVAMTATEGVAVVKSKDEETEKGPSDDDVLKCEQLVHHPPGVEEIRRAADLAIESRELRLEPAGQSYRWVVYRSRGSTPEGWRQQNSLDKLHFNPPLYYLLPDKTTRYVAYAVSVPETPQDSEVMMTVADDFGSRAGNFEWHSKHFDYSVSKKLPCFPGPEE
jgi:hypothetical protein